MFKRLFLTIGLLCGLAMPVHAAALVNTATAHGGAGGIGPTSSTNMNGANLCVSTAVYYSQGSPATGTVSDGSNTFTQLATATNAGNDIRSDMSYHYYSSPISGSLTFTGTGQFGSMVVACYSGMSSSAPTIFNSNAQNASIGTTIQPGSITPAANSIVVTAVGVHDDTAGTSTVNSGYTIQASVSQIGGTSDGIYYADQTFAVSSATNPTWTYNNSSPQTAASTTIGAFPISAGGVATTTQITLTGAGK